MVKRGAIIAGVLALGLLVSVSGCSKGTAKQAQAQTQMKSSSSASSENAKAVKAAGLLSKEEGPVAPAWTLEKIGGGTASLADYKGKVVILDFWDTWCPPCKKEIPGFIELQEKYGDQGLVVIGAAFGRDGKGAVEQFVKEWKMNYPVVIADGQTNRVYGGINSIPTTFVIDRDGQARAKHVGYVQKEVFEEQIKALL